MPQLITTNGNLAADPVVTNWGVEHKNFGLHYKKKHSVDTLSSIFTGQYNQALLQPIIADMNEYGFGIIDDIRFTKNELEHLFSGVYPITKVDDNLQNCLWHADNVRLNSSGVQKKHFDPQAITMLYGERIETEKHTGFASVAAVSFAYNNVSNNADLTRPIVESLCDLADVLGGNVNKNRHTINRLLRNVDAQLKRQEYTDACVHHTWVPHQTGRLILFSNSIVHANDMVHKDVKFARSNRIYRRMLPSTPLHKAKK